jgi:hypothetical protein
MWWSIVLVVLVVAAMVWALVVARRRAALGSSTLGADHTANQGTKSTLSDPKTGLGQGNVGGL